ncbi:hypothetical protein GCM10010466_40460 [Planomonospora alba]|uniref:Uncharacterized protein n=1 Tax=Planomonospora alba TaxID=161354 RepID=A0ABP6NE94_9ACTN
MKWATAAVLPAAGTAVTADISGVLSLVLGGVPAVAAGRDRGGRNRSFRSPAARDSGVNAACR